MTRILVDRIEERLEAVEKTAEGASKEAGLGRDFIRTLQRRPETSPRAANLSKLARVLDCSLPYLLGESEIPGRPPSDDGGADDGSVHLPIRYEAAGGAFRLRDEIPQRPYGFRSVPAIKEYAAFDQWLELVRGPSMNKIIPDGSTVHVVDAIQLGYEPAHDDIVVVERTRAQGALVERTVKQVVFAGRRVELWPRSFSEEWQFPIVLQAKEADTTVEIVGKVIAAYMRFAGSA